MVFTKGGSLSVLDTERIREARQVPAAAAYDRRMADRTLTFDRRNGGILDRETGSTWDVLGRAVAGPLAGRRLTQVDSGVHFAFAWLVFRPDSEVMPGSGAAR